MECTYCGVDDANVRIFVPYRARGAFKDSSEAHYKCLLESGLYCQTHRAFKDLYDGSDDLSCLWCRDLARVSGPTSAMSAFLTWSESVSILKQVKELISGDEYRALWKEGHELTKTGFGEHVVISVACLVRFAAIQKEINFQELLTILEKERRIVHLIAGWQTSRHFVGRRKDKEPLRLTGES